MDYPVLLILLEVRAKFLQNKYMQNSQNIL